MNGLLNGLDVIESYAQFCINVTGDVRGGPVNLSRDPFASTPSRFIELGESVFPPLSFLPYTPTHVHCTV